MRSQHRVTIPKPTGIMGGTHPNSDSALGALGDSTRG
jgi:hypothetical protein